MYQEEPLFYGSVSHLCIHMSASSCVHTPSLKASQISYALLYRRVSMLSTSARLHVVSKNPCNLVSDPYDLSLLSPLFVFLLESINPSPFLHQDHRSHRLWYNIVWYSICIETFYETKLQVQQQQQQQHCSSWSASLYFSWSETCSTTMYNEKKIVFINSSNCYLLQSPTIH